LMNGYFQPAISRLNPGVMHEYLIALGSQLVGLTVQAMLGAVP
jgi:hypothetical protein